MDFMEFHRYEMDALKDGPWEKWVTKVERIIGHDLDGNQSTDGYSLDFAFLEFERGVSAKDYAAKIPIGKIS